MEEKNKTKLILKILLISFIILFLIYYIFFLGKNKNNEVSVSPEYSKIQRNMLQLKNVAEKYKEETGFYNNSDEVIDVDFCKIDSNIFTGSGNGHFLCSIIVSDLPQGLNIKINSKNEENSMYCISKLLENGEKACMDYSGYFGISSGCDSDYKCK